AIPSVGVGVIRCRANRIVTDLQHLPLRKNRATASRDEMIAAKETSNNLAAIIENVPEDVLVISQGRGINCLASRTKVHDRVERPVPGIDARDGPPQGVINRIGNSGIFCRLETNISRPVWVPVMSIGIDSPPIRIKISCYIAGRIAMPASSVVRHIYHVV